MMSEDEDEMTTAALSSKPEVVEIPPAVPRQHAALLATRWAIMVPAAILAMNIFQNTMRYLIAHGSEEMFTLPGSEWFAGFLVSVFAGGVGVTVVAYIAPAKKSTVAIVFASVVSTLFAGAILVLIKRSPPSELAKLGACIIGMIFAAVKIGIAESR